jgi:ubiquinone/menaquinone biosynthesis C-methylase UbiE
VAFVVFPGIVLTQAAKYVVDHIRDRCCTAPAVDRGETSGGSMYKEFRFEGSTPEQWARNFALSKKITFLRKLKIRLDKRYRLIQKYFKHGGKILDAGCGFGEWVSYLNGKHFVATGLDYSETLINRLSIAYPATEWIAGKIEEIPAADSTFDGVISWGVIEHNEAGPETALSEIFRILKPGGYAIVTVPFEDALAIRSSKLQNEINTRKSPPIFFNIT